MPRDPVHRLLSKLRNASTIEEKIHFAALIREHQKDTARGNKILDETWRNQFIGKSAADPLIVVKTASKGDREINAISGATISSKSVTGIINTATTRLRPVLTSPKSNKGNNKE